MNIKTVLLVTDFSDNARTAYPAACSLAKEFGAQLHLAHEAESLFAAYVETVTTSVGLTTYYQEKRDQLVKESGHPLFEGLSMTTHLLYPNADQATVLGLLDAHEFDLVVLSTHGHTGPSHVLLGSFAANIARCSPVPVLTYRENPKKTPFHPRSILVPDDFSRNAAAAFPIAGSFAKHYGADLAVLNVLPARHELVYAGDALARVQENLERRCGTEWKDSTPECVASTGTPYNEIVEQACARETDLIVMATNGHKNINRLIFGSVAEKVLRLAPCPVLTVRPSLENTAPA